jgi:hypothetical protein
VNNLVDKQERCTLQYNQKTGTDENNRQANKDNNIANTGKGSTLCQW